jgi:hypothetical protein
MVKRASPRRSKRCEHSKSAPIDGAPVASVVRYLLRQQITSAGQHDAGGSLGHKGTRHQRGGVPIDESREECRHYLT